MYYPQTPYHRKVAHKLQKAKERQKSLQNNRYTQIVLFIQAYEKAHFEYYRVPAGITYKHGWYYMNGQKYRHTQMEQRLAVLFAQLQELESPNLDDNEVQDDQPRAA